MMMAYFIASKRKRCGKQVNSGHALAQQPLIFHRFPLPAPQNTGICASSQVYRLHGNGMAASGLMRIFGQKHAVHEPGVPPDLMARASAMWHSGKDRSMRKNLPGSTELMIFAALAVICAGVVSSSAVQDLGLSLLSIPVFIGAALWGMFRTGQLVGGEKTGDAADEE
jgi:hypothetical protein